MKKLITVLVVVVAYSATAAATVVLPTDLGELTRDARTISRGRIITVESHWTENRRAIETLVTLDAETYLKGALGPTVQFRVPGGRLGRFRSITVGAPQFTVGQRVIVFLGTRGPSVPYILGLSQGVFRLTPDSTGGWTVIPPPILPLAMSARPATVVRGDPMRTAAPLVEFEQRVRALVVSPQ